MSGQRSAQAFASESEQPSSALDASRSRLKVGEMLPAACDAKDLARAFGRTTNCIYNWHSEGKLRRCELSRPFGSKRWSGRLVHAALDGPSPLVVLKRNA